MISGLHHAGISSPDIDRLAAFYADLFGFETVWEAEWPIGTSIIDEMLGIKDVAGRVIMMRTGTGFLELIQFQSPEPKPRDSAWRAIDHGLTHICVNVDDLKAEMARLTARGVRFLGPPATLGGPASAAYCRDPDGNIIELLEITDDSWPTHFDNRYLAKKTAGSR